MESRPRNRTALFQSAFVIATGAGVFWILMEIPREATVYLIEQGPIRWLTYALWSVAVIFLLKYWPGIREHWRGGLVLGVMGWVLLFGSGVMDRAQKSMRDRGPTGDRYVLGIAEEVLEIIVPVFFILALIQIGTRIRQSKGEPEPFTGDRIDP